MAIKDTKVTVTTTTGTEAEPYDLGSGDTYTVTTKSDKAVSGGAVNVEKGAYAVGTDLNFEECNAQSEDRSVSGGAVSNSGTITFNGTTTFNGNIANAGANSANGGALYNSRQQFLSATLVA